MSKPKTERWTSLDQFRGYAVCGMIVVNFLGNYACCPRILRHTNDYCSYADTIMPNFLFAVGLAIAIVWNRIAADDLDGKRRIQGKLIKRSIALMIVALLIYFPWGQEDLRTKILKTDFWFAIWKRDWFQTLTHIAWTTLWIVPILPSRWPIRIAWIAGGALAHAALSELVYFQWVHANPGAIDGGPLGFLTWSIPATVGLWAGQQWNQLSPTKWFVISCALMAVGYLLSCPTRMYDRSRPATESSQKLANSPALSGIQDIASGKRLSWAEPPFVPPPTWEHRAWNYWMMSQKAGTLSYLIFSAGFSLTLFLLFDGLIKQFHIDIGIFRSFGRNAITCYAIHGFLIDGIGGFLRKDSAAWSVVLALAALIAALYAFARILEANKIFIRL